MEKFDFKSLFEKVRKSDVRNYELAVVFKVNESTQTDAVPKVREYIQNSGGKITAEDTMGQRRLAYPIRKNRQKFTDGYYHFFKIELPVLNIDVLERYLKYDENILRYMLIKED